MDVDVRDTKFFPWIIAGIFLFIVASAYLVYRQIQIRNLLSSPTSYEECLKSPGNLLQESYPATCVAKNGARFTQPLTQKEQQTLKPPHETENWETYMNDQYNFSFKYPEDFEISKDDLSILKLRRKTAATETLLKISPQYSTNIATLKTCEAVSTQFPCRPADTKISEVTIDNRNANRFELLKGLVNANFEIIQISEPKIEIEVYLDLGDQRIFIDDILSTFKFLPED